MDTMNSLKNIIDQKSLRWIFVGGRGGVGKTTCSCALAAQLSKVRDTVLLVSIYSPHNISNTFEQNFSIVPTKVQGFDNLFVMELDQKALNMQSEGATENETVAKRLGKHLAKYLIHTFHGHDEVLKYAEILKVVNENNFSVVVFDVSTGDTLRFVSFLQKFEKDFAQLFHVKLQFSERYNTDTLLECVVGFDYDVFSNEMDKMLDVMTQIHFHFKQPAETTFVYVDVANPLYLPENRVLFRHLAMLGLHTCNIVVNKLTNLDTPYNFNNKNHYMEVNYLELLPIVFKYFYVTKLPFLNKELKGAVEINSFSEYLIKPYFMKNQNAN